MIILGTWLIISILSQFRRFKWIKLLKYYDPFALIPSWYFFAPNPGVTDYRVLYRDKLFDGQFTVWKEVDYHRSSLLHAIWNPEKRRRKAITDTCSFLLQTASKKTKSKRLLVSVPYLAILTYVVSMPHNNLSEYRQFMIARTHGQHTTKEPEILFISNQHRL